MGEWAINANGMINEVTLFTLIWHRINNTGWNDEMVVERRGGTKCENPILRECWTILIYIFLHKKRKQCLEFALPKPGEICKHLVGAYNSNSHARGLHYLTFVCGNKAGKINTTGQVVFRKNVLEKLSIINPLWRRRRPFVSWIH